MPKVKKSWDDRYEDLRAFCKANGHCNTSFKTCMAIHIWAVEQRKGRDGLSPHQIKLLNDLDFDWETKEMKSERKWEEMLELLKEYKKENGDTRVKAHVLFRGKRLGIWTNSQRRAFRERKLPDHRKDKLEQIGFEWIRDERLLWKEDRNNTHLEDSWNKGFRALYCYQKKHSTTCVPDGFMIRLDNHEDFNLGTWVSWQRKQHKAGKLLPKRRQKLESIDFVFEIDHDDPQASARQQVWEDRFAKLVAFKEGHGHSNVPYDWEEDKALGQWVSKQRAKYSKGKLRPARVCKLDEIGFEWEPFEARWKEMIEQLREFRTKHGHCRIRCDRRSQLARWVYAVRYRRRETSSRLSALTPEQIEELDKLGFEWSAPYGFGGKNRTFSTEADSPRRRPKRHLTSTKNKEPKETEKGEKRRRERKKQRLAILDSSDEE